jgi:hypothetical protein
VLFPLTDATSCVKQEHLAIKEAEAANHRLLELPIVRFKRFAGRMGETSISPRPGESQIFLALAIP